jgi:hypothetical protein
MSSQCPRMLKWLPTLLYTEQWTVMRATNITLHKQVVVLPQQGVVCVQYEAVFTIASLYVVMIISGATAQIGPWPPLRVS